MSKILLTGGGTAGHATPNIALIPKLSADGHEIIYIGTYSGIERELVEKTGIKYYPISAGKLRRYISAKNISDVFRIMKGYSEAKKIIKKEKPDVVFSKGGFVTVPVVYAASDAKIPVIIHESDITPGLANKLSLKKAKHVCVSFESTIDNIKSKACTVTGLPVRNELLHGSREKGLEYLGFNGEKPVLLIIGGSLGAQAVNEAVDGAISEITELFDVVHVRGKGKLNDTLGSLTAYRQYEYISEELADVMTASDIVLSRAGANVIFELLALKKPMLLVPLPLESSRGDQILNADFFKSKGFAHVLPQNELSNESIIDGLKKLLSDSDAMIEKMNNSCMTNGTENVINIIYRILKEKNDK